METIKVIGGGINGSASYSIFDSKGQPIITKKGINIIAEEIKRRYPEIADKIVIASNIFEEHKVEEIDFSTLQPTAKHDLISRIIEISSKK